MMSQGGSKLGMEPQRIPDADAGELSAVDHRVYGRPTDMEADCDLSDREQALDSECA